MDQALFKSNVVDSILLSSIPEEKVLLPVAEYFFFGWKSSPLTAKIYHRSKLALRFRIRPQLLPLLASLAGNDYVSADALVDFNSALSRVQSDYRVGKREARFAKTASLLRELPILCSQEEALKSTLELITSQRNRNTLQQVIELSLQE